MRALMLLAIAASLALPGAAADEAYIVVADWHDGHFVVGTRVGIDDVDLWRAPVALDGCHREVILDLLYEPADTAIDVPGVGSVVIDNEFRAEIWNAEGTSMISSTRVIGSGHGRPLGTVPAGGSYEVRLSLVVGLGVDWSARLRAHEVVTDPLCGGVLGAA